MAYSMKVFLPWPPPMAVAARLFRGPALHTTRHRMMDDTDRGR